MLDQVVELVSELEALALPLTEALVEALADGVELSLAEEDGLTVAVRLRLAG